ncbi:MAG: hypothetical protein HYV07_10560 [Deltaproteobacteria bacterium]|nr:hypothetical protein [Deltaproteobacteria bacterium]
MPLSRFGLVLLAASSSRLLSLAHSSAIAISSSITVNSSLRPSHRTSQTSWATSPRTTCGNNTFQMGA